MRNHFIALLLLAQAAFLPTLQSADPPPDAPKIFQLDGSYGTLIYKGTVERALKGSDYHYTVKNLALKYTPFTAVNETSEIAINVDLVATTRPTSGDGSWTRIFVQTFKTKEVLHLPSSTVTIKEISFTIPKATVDKSDSVGLTVTDEKLPWPFGEELK